MHLHGRIFVYAGASLVPIHLDSMASSAVPPDCSVPLVGIGDLSDAERIPPKCWR